METGSAPAQSARKTGQCPTPQLGKTEAHQTASSQALDVKVETTMLTQVHVPEQVRTMGRALQDIVQVPAVLLRVIQEGLSDVLIIAKGSSHVRHVLPTHLRGLRLRVVHVSLHHALRERPILYGSSKRVAKGPHRSRSATNRRPSPQGTALS